MKESGHYWISFNESQVIIHFRSADRNQSSRNHEQRRKGEKKRNSISWTLFLTLKPINFIKLRSSRSQKLSISCSVDAHIKYQGSRSRSLSRISRPCISPPSSVRSASQLDSLYSYTGSLRKHYYKRVLHLYAQKNTLESRLS